jgi:hypothetical protein
VRPAVLLLVLAATAGCVEPTIGPVEPPPRADKPAFAVDLVTPSSAPSPTQSGGAVDHVEPGAVTVVTGWAPSEDARLIVVVPEAAELINNRRVRRPDAAASTGEPSHVELGFRLTLRGRGPTLERVCVLAVLPDGATSKLAGSDSGLCPA